MLRRKIEDLIREHLSSGTAKILMIDGARQVGKTTSVRCVGQALFPKFAEINMVEDSLGDRLFERVRTIEDFYLALSVRAGQKIGDASDTLVFLDEIQAYPHLLTLLKFLAEDGRFRYIASGSLLGVTLAQTPSIPMGSLRRVRMFPLDFEEFLWANAVGEAVIEHARERIMGGQSLDENLHAKFMDLFRKYLLIGGLPEAVQSYLEDFNIHKVREIHREIHAFYAADAAKYEQERRLQIRRIYEMIPSNMENKKKRIVAQDIEGRRGKGFADYQDEFEYLISAGIALPVQAIANPRFPLLQSSQKNLLKLYLNDVGLLTALLYGENILPILGDERSINLGSIYEAVVAQELTAHGHSLFYYDNRKKGEVDFLIDDYDGLSVLPIEVKSGKDYRIHSALNALLANEDYAIREGLLLSNERLVAVEKRVVYRPIFSVMFL